MAVYKHPAVRNLALLVFVVLPGWILLIFAQAALFPLEWMREAGVGWSVADYLGGLLFWFLLMVVPVLVGGAIHQVIICALAPDHSRRRERVGILATSPVILLALAVLSPSPAALLLPRAAVPALIAMIVYGLLAESCRTFHAPSEGGVPRDRA
jgi:hypothetical protein